MRYYSTTCSVFILLLCAACSSSTESGPEPLDVNSSPGIGSTFSFSHVVRDSSGVKEVEDGGQLRLVQKAVMRFGRSDAWAFVPTESLVDSLWIAVDSGGSFYRYIPEHSINFGATSFVRRATWKPYLNTPGSVAYETILDTTREHSGAMLRTWSMVTTTTLGASSINVAGQELSTVYFESVQLDSATLDGRLLPALHEGTRTLTHVIPKWGIVAQEVTSWPFGLGTSELKLTGAVIK